jgi:tetratricopeptide (TPR) repeat protein
MENIKDKQNSPQSTEEECSPFEKIMNLNKLGALFLSADKYDKALSILTKTYEFYITKKESKEIPNFFYSNLYCNLAKAHSCLKNFKEAEKYYIECILNHPLYKILLNEKEFIKNEFLIDVDNLLTISEGIKIDDILNKFDIIMNFFSCNKEIESELENKLSLSSEKPNFNQKISKKFKPNNLTSLSSFTDSLVNLAVIFQFYHKETTTAFDMYYLALLLEPDNNVANIDFNNFLREVNLKEKSDLYIKQRIKYGYIKERGDDSKEIDIEINSINAKKDSTQSLHEQSLAFVCMKWGTKYGADYVNKLYHGVKRNTTKKFNFFCITDNSADLHEEIKILKLESNFKGWMRKSILFWDNYTNQLTSQGEELICFIDLDMIIYSNIEFLWNYPGVSK